MTGRSEWILSDVDQLHIYQQLLTEILPYVTPDLKTTYKAEIMMVQGHIRRLLTAKESFAEGAYDGLHTTGSK